MPTQTDIENGLLGGLDLGHQRSRGTIIDFPIRLCSNRLDPRSIGFCTQHLSFASELIPRNEAIATTLQSGEAGELHPSSPSTSREHKCILLLDLQDPDPTSLISGV